jgi:hypothetical protein
VFTSRSLPFLDGVVAAVPFTVALALPALTLVALVPLGEGGSMLLLPLASSEILSWVWAEGAAAEAEMETRVGATRFTAALGAGEDTGEGERAVMTTRFAWSPVYA